MTFNEWVTQWCEVDTFEETEEHFNDLADNCLNAGDDIISYMEQAFHAGVKHANETRS